MNPQRSPELQRQSLIESANALARVLTLLAYRLHSGSSEHLSEAAELTRTAEELFNEASTSDANERLLKTMQRGTELAEKAAKRLQRKYKGNVLQRLIWSIFQRTESAEAAALAAELLHQLDQQHTVLGSVKPTLVVAPRRLPTLLLL